MPGVFVEIPLGDFTTSGGLVAVDQFVQAVLVALPARTILECFQDFMRATVVFDLALTPTEQSDLAVVVAAHTATGRITDGAVAALSLGEFEGEEGFATDGRKVGEPAAGGTGVPIYWSDSAWRVFSTDAPVDD